MKHAAAILIPSITDHALNDDLGRLRRNPLAIKVGILLFFFFIALISFSNVIRHPERIVQEDLAFQWEGRIRPANPVF